ncbi:MAG: transcription elongation factor GreA [Chitinophagales bacterium]|nr:transcription elongation factor GreA [Bacteroidota bacterium]MBX7142189.1 transcription elongation factor GreA [Chitinophagales bacterium]
MADLTYFTPEGLDKLKKELQDLRTRGRSEIARAIQEAREKGDLSENAEYHAAKEAQGFLEMKISQLEDTLANARLIDTSKLDNSKVMLMSKVTVKNMNNKQVNSYTIVSEKEADLKAGKISITSPIGKGLLGKVVGEVTEISIPSGTLKLEVVEINL